ncbi:MAG: hypothetical protein OEU93_01970 [Rubrivivax sp.]|nr:hypothetical protein [Rubrivivax sp.]MDH5338999.1 hypothetical protein [Rubrivivax sp.]
MFDTTQPVGTPRLMRVSGFRRYLDEAVAGNRLGRSSTRLSSLGPSLLNDLLRFERDDKGSELLEVLAGSMRHGCNLLIHLALGSRVIPLTVFPAAGLAHSPLPFGELAALRLNALAVMHVEPALLAPPGPGEPVRASTTSLYGPLPLLAWELALRGARDTLLPELAGSAAYRLTPAADLRALALSGSLAAAAVRLRRETTNLRDIASWPGFNRERAMRLLNGLYLQAALIVSRSHPAAAGDPRRPAGG